MTPGLAATGAYAKGGSGIVFQAVVLLAVFAATVAAVPPLAKRAERVGLVDAPGGRKDHGGSVPLVGGIAIFLGVSAGAALVAALPPMLLGGLLGMAGYLLLGLADDRFALGGGLKLAIQVAIATALVVASGSGIWTLGDLFGAGAIDLPSPWSEAFAVFVIVGIVNAVNMADGVDGLAGGVVLTAVLWLAVAAGVNGAAAAETASLLVGAGVAGFLVFNYRSRVRPHALVFLGDAGSMMLGFAIAWCGIWVLAADGPVTPAGIGWIVALPAVDTLSLMVRRLKRGRSPFTADREHLHHVFLRAGFSPAQTTDALIAIEILLGALGVLGCLAGAPDALLFALLLPFVAAHYYFVFHAWRTMKALKRLRRMAALRRRDR